MGWWSACSTDSLEPQARVEFTVVGLDLPAVDTEVLVAAVLGVEDVDALDVGGADGDVPSERHNVACNGVDVDDREGNVWLPALADLECKLGGEGDGALGDAGEEVDAVGCICEVRGE